MDIKTEEELKEILWRNRARRRDMFPQLLERVCKYYNVTEEQLKSKSRESIYVEPRHVIFYVAHHYYRIPSKEVGRALNRDHTSVIYAVKKYREYLDLGVDKQFRKLINKFIID